jgi:hypothetical protein
MARTVSPEIKHRAAMFVVWRTLRNVASHDLTERDSDLSDIESLPVFVGRNRAGTVIQSNAEEWG